MFQIEIGKNSIFYLIYLKAYTNMAIQYHVMLHCRILFIRDNGKKKKNVYYE